MPIGLGLATCNDWGHLREVYHDNPGLLEVIDYLEANFTTNAWCERRTT